MEPTGFRLPSYELGRSSMQGDPLPSVLFNIVIDHLLRSLPKVRWPWFGGGTRAMTFTDDMNLIGETPLGFEALIDHSMA